MQFRVFFIAICIAISTFKICNQTEALVISDMAELGKYFKKYKLVLLDEYYIDSEKVIYVDNKQKFDKIIYIQQ